MTFERPMISICIYTPHILSTSGWLHVLPKAGLLAHPITGPGFVGTRSGAEGGRVSALRLMNTEVPENGRGLNG